MNGLIVCGGDAGTASVRDPNHDLDGCVHALHDWPCPGGYTDHAIEAGWRLRNHWRQARCPLCHLYGWVPGKLTDQHVRRPAKGANP